KIAATAKMITFSARITSPTVAKVRLLRTTARISVPSRTPPPRIASPTPAPTKNPPKTEPSNLSTVAAGNGISERQSARATTANVLMSANVRPTWRYPTTTNGAFTTTSQIGSGTTVNRASNIETPVTPPSIK